MAPPRYDQTCLDRIEWEARKSNYSQFKMECPFCSEARRKKRDPCLSVSYKGDHILWNCWHCSRSGIIRTEEHKPIMKPTRIENGSGLTPEQYSFLSVRGISRDTANKYKLFSQIKFFPRIGEKRNSISFPYYNKDHIYAAKHRALDKAFVTSGAPQTLWNINNVEEGEELIITEGEMDALSLLECGLKNVVSIPNGAVERIIKDKPSPEEDKKFIYLWNAKDKLDKFKKIILALDDDRPGEVTAEEVARRLGRAKCWSVKYPEKCKDFNDVLIKHDKKTVLSIIKRAEPWPVSGLYSAEEFEEDVLDLYANGLGRGESTGYPAVDEIFTIVPGHLTIITGIPSSGKTEFIDQLLVNLAEQSGWKAAICSFENQPKIHIANLIAKRERRSFFGEEGWRLNKEALDRSFMWVNEHFKFLYRADGEGSTVEDIIDRLKSAVMRYGIRAAVVDPYNYIVRSDKFSETDWISDMLGKMRMFAQAHDVHLFFVAHPTKLQKSSDGSIPPPGGYDISGSAAWFNKADNGLTIHRTSNKGSEVLVIVWKGRYNWVSKPGECVLYYDTRTHRYDQSCDWLIEQINNA